MYSVVKNMLVSSAVTLALGGFLHTAAADTQANKESYRRCNQEAWSQGKLAVLDEFVAAGYVYHEPAVGEVHGVEGLKQTISAYRTAYPDLHFTIDDLIAEGDLVAMRWSATGTQKGNLLGIPATGLKTAAVGINIARFEAGKMLEEWSSWDVMGLMQQLGVIVPPRAGPGSYVWGAASQVTGAPGKPLANKAVVLHNVEAFWNRKNASILTDTHRADLVAHNPVMPVHPLDFDTYLDACLMHWVAFPDLNVTVDHLIAEEDKVVEAWTVSGTHRGDLMGVPASGKRVQFKGITIYRFVDGKVVEDWWAYDALGLMQQITSPPEWSPAGNWVVSLPTPLGHITFLHTVSPQEEPGAMFAGVMKQVNGNPTNFGMFPEVEAGSDWATQTMRTGRNHVETTMLAYGTKKGAGPVAETAVIYIARSEWTLTGPDTNEGTATLSVYLAAQDADQDGFPDEGEKPIQCMPFVFTSKRLTMMPGCVPTPLPEAPKP